MNEVERLLRGGSGQEPTEWVREFRCAVRAGWWTLLIGAVILTYSWLMGLLLLRWGVPDWVLTLWGGVSVAEFRLVWICFLGLMKAGLFCLLLALLWATLWLRSLKKQGLRT